VTGVGGAVAVFAVTAAEVAGWVAGVLAGLAFVVAGASKLADPSWPAQAAGLGAPRPVAAVLPFVEIAVGAPTAVGLGGPWPPLAAAALLVAFSALLVVRLRSGRRPPCACFGRWSARPIGWGHVARNAVLLVAALAAAVLPR
jgi:hypothetical protein